MSQECIFCRIAVGQAPAVFLHQDEQVVAFRDINPQAPVHILVIPRKHIPSLAELAAGDEAVVAHLVHIANQVADKEGVKGRGYRLVISCGKEGGQVVPHLHLHLLGGRQLAGRLG